MDDYSPNKYKLLNKIGEGVHGVVIKAINLFDNKYVAIKKLQLNTKYGNISINTLREIKVLQNCDHENILKLIDIYPDLYGLSLVFDFIPYTLQFKIKDDNNPISRSKRLLYMKMLLCGLNYLHNIGIIHRDVKPQNLLINEEDVLKIADFGLSRLYNVNDETNKKALSPQVATRWYRAPELLWGSLNYGPSIDIWASGCVFAEMLGGIPLFGGNTDIEQLALVVRTLGTPCVTDWPELTSLPDYNKIRFPHSKGFKWNEIFPSCTTEMEIDLVKNLVQYNPQKRLKASEALLHDYFKE